MGVSIPMSDTPEQRLEEIRDYTDKLARECPENSSVLHNRFLLSLVDTQAKQLEEKRRGLATAGKVIDAFVERVDALTAQVAQGEADTKRLDTAQRLYYSADFAYKNENGTREVILIDIPRRVGITPSLRHFLDDATKALSEESL